jgi:hypothetical protein
MLDALTWTRLFGRIDPTLTAGRRLRRGPPDADAL